MQITIAAAFAIAATKERLARDTDQGLQQMLLFMRERLNDDGLPLQQRAIMNLLCSCIIDEIANRIIDAIDLDALAA